MKLKKTAIILLSSVLLTTSCKDLFEPEIQNNRQLEEAYNDPIFFQGILGNGYVRIPTNGWIWSDLATDNAVARDVNNGFYRMAQGEWAANNNPLSMWNQCYTGIQFMNMILDIADKSQFVHENEHVNKMFQDRMKGEAYGLRALFMYHLLLNHAGKVNGQLMGVPIVTVTQDVRTDFNQPRSTFEACVQQVFNDVAQASTLLPDDYFDRTSDDQVPAKYREMGINVGDYNRPFGKEAQSLMSGKIASAVRAQVALLAASPAYSDGSGVTWNEAAGYIADLLDKNGGVSGVDPNGLIWYLGSQIDANVLPQGANPKEILWRDNIQTNNSSLEADHFPPTLYGRGLLNPTQNLVDAFPTINGYPIDDPTNRGGYNPASPYANRDPRLGQFILYNGTTAGTTNSIIYTAIDGGSTGNGTDDGLNRSNNATRTGYYMKKLLRQDVNLNPASVTGQRHIKPRMRYTDFYLGFAEAANEAWGPIGTGGHAYSAYDIVKAIRKRAGIGLTNGDAYLEEAKNNKEIMRELIRNERRLELCFEGYRFWDLRRWKEDLNETAKGIQIQGGQHTIIDVQQRVFGSHAIYGPLPNSEVLKFPALDQNADW